MIGRSPSAPSDNQALYQPLHNTIANSPEGRISFADYMAAVLYDPSQGYYTRGSVEIGTKGDFVTAAHLGPDFGELLAVQLTEIWQRLGRPHPFAVIEMGAGQGLIAEQILGYWQRHTPELLSQVNYTLVETSAALRSMQQQRLAPWQDRAAVEWRSLPDIPNQSVTGCVFSNELVDALPVHRVQVTEAGLQEIYVTTCGGQESHSDSLFREVLGPLSTPALERYFERLKIDLTAYGPGYSTEVNLAALDWLTTVSQKIRQGVLITIDYGYLAERYYGRSRSQGTLQCYYRHRHHSDPYRFIGSQDLTAHVDFTTLQQHGEQCGLTTLGLTRQSLFLMALGLGERLMALSQSSATTPEAINAAITRRNRLHRLIDPTGMGNFYVLLQGKNFPPAENGMPLQGLATPPL